MKIIFIPLFLSYLIVFPVIIFFYTAVINSYQLSLNSNLKIVGNNFYIVIIIFLVIMLIIIKILKKFTNKNNMMKYLVVNGLATGVLIFIILTKPQLSFIIRLPLIIFQTFLSLKYEGTMGDHSLNNLSLESMLLTIILVPMILFSNIMVLTMYPLATILSMGSTVYLFRTLWIKFSKLSKKNK